MIPPASSGQTSYWPKHLHRPWMAACVAGALLGTGLLQLESSLADPPSGNYPAPAPRAAVYSESDAVSAEETAAEDVATASAPGAAEGEPASLAADAP